jgi:hypothetical protein
MKRSTQCNLKSRDKSDAATNQEHQGAPKAWKARNRLTDCPQHWISSLWPPEL